MIPGVVAGRAIVGGGGGTDPHFANVQLLLHMDGPDDSTSFPDSSSFVRTMVPNGGAHVSTDESVFGGAAGEFSGTAYLQSTSNMSFGTGDFTVEGFVRFDTTADMGFLAGLNNAEMDFAFVGNEMRLGRLNTAWDSVFPFTRSTGIWYHVAWCREGTGLRAFVDGVQAGSTATNSTAYNAVSDFKIGASTGADRRFDGFIDEVRITAGVARYTANFTPPAAPFPNS